MQFLQYQPKVQKMNQPKAIVLPMQIRFINNLLIVYELFSFCIIIYSVNSSDAAHLSPAGGFLLKKTSWRLESDNLLC
jgi:hypothetical protein